MPDQVVRRMENLPCKGGLRLTRLRLSGTTTLRGAKRSRKPSRRVMRSRLLRATRMLRRKTNGAGSLRMPRAWCTRASPQLAHPSLREIVSDPFGHNSVAALGVSDQSEIEWKAIDDPRLAIHGPKNLRDRFRHLVKTAKREVQNERPRTPEGAAQEVSFQGEREAIVEASSVPRLTPGYLQMPSRSF